MRVDIYSCMWFHPFIWMDFYLLGIFLVFFLLRFPTKNREIRLKTPETPTNPWDFSGPNSCRRFPRRTWFHLGNGVCLSVSYPSKNGRETSCSSADFELSSFFDRWCISFGFLHNKKDAWKKNQTYSPKWWAMMVNPMVESIKNKSPTKRIQDHGMYQKKYIYTLPSENSVVTDGRNSVPICAEMYLHKTVVKGWATDDSGARLFAINCIIQGEPVPVINAVISPINGLISE